MTQERPQQTEPAPDDVEALIVAYGRCCLEFGARKGDDAALKAMEAARTALLAAFARLKEELSRITDDRDAKSKRMWELGHKCDAQDVLIAALERENERLHRFNGSLHSTESTHVAEIMAQARRIAELESLLARYQWVPVSERLPTHEGEYLAAYPSRHNVPEPYQVILDIWGMPSGETEFQWYSGSDDISHWKEIGPLPADKERR